MSPPLRTPHNEELERAVLGALMQAPGNWAAAAGQLAPEAFHQERHRLLWDALARLAKRGLAPAAAAVVEELRSLSRLEAVGGEAAVWEIEAAVPDASALEPHCEMLRELQVRREMLDDFGSSIQDLYDPQTQMPDVLDRAEKAVTRAAMKLERSGSLTTGAQAVESFITDGFEMEQDEEGRWTWRRRWGMTCGLPEFDRILHGFRRGNVTVVLSQPNVGKTMLMLNLADYFAGHGHPTLYFTLEQPAGEIGARLVAIRSGLRDDQLSQEKGIDPRVVNEVMKTAEQLKKLPLYVDDGAGLSLRRLRSEVRRAVRQHGVHVVMVDYLQLMEVEGASDRRDLQVADISRGVKLLARECGLHIFMACQCSRQTAKRTSPEPLMTDARESSAIEADADIILGLWNDPLRKKDEGKEEEILKRMRRINIRILKNRQGPGRGLRADVQMLPGRARIVQLTRDDIDALASPGAQEGVDFGAEAPPQQEEDDLEL